MYGGKGFYDGISSFDLQPYGKVHGHFRIRILTEKAGYTVEQLEKEANDENIKRQLYLNIEFWYNPMGVKAIVENPS